MSSRSPSRLPSVALLFVTSGLATFGLGCEEALVDCFATPEDSVCQESCAADPTRPYCADGGEIPDGEVDAAADGAADGGLPCDDACAGDTPHCDIESNTCVACLEASHCGAPTTMCVAGACVECTSAAECTSSAAPVCGAAGACVGCTESADCDRFDTESADFVCETSSGACVGCLVADNDAEGRNAACPSDSPYCDAGACLPCLDDADCTDPAATACSRSGTGGLVAVCVGCSADTECADDAGAAGAHPGLAQCDEDRGLCVECTASSECSAPTSLCDGADDTCVECIGDGDCGTGYCDEDLGTRVCVECEQNAHCPTGARSRCEDAVDGANVCEACASDADCTHVAGAPYCDTTAGTGCHACLSDADCPDADRSRCALSTHTCEPCTTNAECAGVVDGAVSLGVCASGTCAECTASDQGACGTNVCDVVGGLGRCSTSAAGSASTCDTCVASAQCAANHVCVPMTYGGTAVGHYCLVDPGTGSCPSPYVSVASFTPVEGGSSVFACEAALTTCAALADHRTSCADATDLSCGVNGLSDGLCRDADIRPAVDDFQCTVECSSNNDCPLTPAATRRYVCEATGYCSFASTVAL